MTAPAKRIQLAFSRRKPEGESIGVVSGGCTLHGYFEASKTAHSEKMNEPF
jgi:hypothetical protein